MNDMLIVILGLSITSSWGNGHAVTYRSLVKGLGGRGHRILFLERDVPWYASNRDSFNDTEHCQVSLYSTLETLFSTHACAVRDADLVIVGSYVPDGIEVLRWVAETALGVIAFYDIDTPVTLAAVERGSCEYANQELIRKCHLYLSFSGGPILSRLEKEFGARAARPFFCSVDPDLYRPIQHDWTWDLGYLGTYSSDRQRSLDLLMIESAQNWNDGQFVVAGPQYPESLQWPPNITRILHLPPGEHCEFYNSQRMTLNLTRQDMINAGWSPSIRLFEAAACGTPIITDRWEGLGGFFNPGEEILIADSARDVLTYLTELSPERLDSISRAARKKVLAMHTGYVRARQLEQYVKDVRHSSQ